MEYRIRTSKELIAGKRLDLEFMLVDRYRAGASGDVYRVPRASVRLREQDIWVSWDGCLDRKCMFKDEQLQADTSCAMPAYDLLCVLNAEQQRMRLEGGAATEVSLYRNGQRLDGLYDFEFEEPDDTKHRFGYLPLLSYDGRRVSDITIALRQHFRQPGTLTAWRVWAAKSGLMFAGRLQEGIDDRAALGAVETGVEPLVKMRLKIKPVKVFTNK